MTEQQPTTALLVGDHPLMRKGLRSLLESETIVILKRQTAEFQMYSDTWNGWVLDVQ